MSGGERKSPFDHLPRRPLFVDAGFGAPVKSVSMRPVEELREAIGAVSADALVSPAASEEGLAEKKRGAGRPSKFAGQKPWEAQGISKALYYKRLKAGKVPPNAP